MSKTIEQLTSEIYSKISNTLLPTDCTAGAAEPNAFVSLMVPGITVKAEDDFYAFADIIPSFNRQFIDSGHRCSDLFKIILGASVPQDEDIVDKTMKKAYKKAMKLLESEIYEKYQKYNLAYKRAQNAFHAQANKMNVEKEEQEVLLADLADELEIALDNLKVFGRKNEVEAALATTSRYLAYTPQTVFAQAGDVFEQAKNKGTNLYPVTYTPSGWMSEPDAMGWVKISITQQSTSEQIHQSVQNIESNTGTTLKTGLWTSDVSANYSDKIQKMNQDTSMESLEISFEVALVSVTRTWFSETLLAYPNCSVSSYAVGGICGGSLAEAKNCMFPSIPTELILARNIKVSNRFSEEEISFFNEVKDLDATAKIGFGPFAINNNTKFHKETQDKGGKTDGKSFTLESGSEMQVIGHVNTILAPKFPSIPFHSKEQVQSDSDV